MKSLSVKRSPFLIPGALVVTLLIIGFFVGRYIVNKTLTLRDEISEVQVNIEILEGRDKVLKNLGGKIGKFSQDTLLALPSTNPALLVSSRIGSLARSYNLEVVDIKSTATAQEEVSEEISSLMVRLEMTGSYDDIASFVDEISNSLPIIKIRKLNVKTDRNGVTADLELVSYWAGFPKSLPDIDSPIDTLSANEQELLDRLARFARPAIQELPQPAPPSLRTDPFTL